VSISTWQTFVTAYQEDIMSTKPRDLMLHTNSPRMMTHSSQGRGAETVFSSHIEQISAPNFEWINLLTLVDANLQRSEWIQLSKLPNLGALYIQNSFTQTGSPDDVVVRAWSRAARSTGAWSVLKVLLLCNQSQITLGTLEDLEYMPSLRILHMTGPTIKSYGVQHLIEGSTWIWMNQ
jgi:hypothetical protein